MRSIFVSQKRGGSKKSESGNHVVHIKLNNQHLLVFLVLSARFLIYNLIRAILLTPQNIGVIYILESDGSHLQLANGGRTDHLGKGVNTMGWFFTSKEEEEQEERERAQEEHNHGQKDGSEASLVDQVRWVVDPTKSEDYDKGFVHGLENPSSKDD